MLQRKRRSKQERRGVGITKEGVEKARAEGRYVSAAQDKCADKCAHSSMVWACTNREKVGTCGVSFP